VLGKSGRVEVSMLLLADLMFPKDRVLVHLGLFSTKGISCGLAAFFCLLVGVLDERNGLCQLILMEHEICGMSGQALITSSIPCRNGATLCINPHRFTCFMFWSLLLMINGSLDGVAHFVHVGRWSYRPNGVGRD
jgi:hypothetical protein